MWGEEGIKDGSDVDSVSIEPETTITEGWFISTTLQNTDIRGSMSFIQHLYGPRSARDL